jgi:hypothetical protein
MKKLILATVLAALTICASAQSKVNIKSKGEDLRQVIASIFEQSNQQYVLETTVRQSLYMSVDNISFEKAIEIISNVADLTFSKKDGVWYINTRRGSKMTAKITPPANSTKADVQKPDTTKTSAKQQTAAQGFATEKEAPKTTAKTLDLTKRLTTKLQKTDIREVFAEFGRQSEVQIEVMSSVPDYKIDAFMFNTSLKFALDRVCTAAGLKYEITPGKTVRISKA